METKKLSSKWEPNWDSLRLKNIGLTAIPRIIQVPYKEIPFLGYIVDNDNLKPESSLGEKILSIPIPRTK